MSGDTASSVLSHAALSGRAPQLSAPCPQVQPRGSKLASPQVRGARAIPWPSAAQRRVRPPPFPAVWPRRLWLGSAVQARLAASPGPQGKA